MLRVVYFHIVLAMCFSCSPFYPWESIQHAGFRLLITCRHNQPQKESWHFNLTVIVSFQIQCAGLQSQSRTVSKRIICSVVLLSNVLHHWLNLFESQYASQHLPPLKITGFDSEFPIILMHSLCVNEPCNLAGRPACVCEHCSDWH